MSEYVLRVNGRSGLWLRVGITQIQLAECDYRRGDLSKDEYEAMKDALLARVVVHARTHTHTHTHTHSLTHSCIRVCLVI